MRLAWWGFWLTIAISSCQSRDVGGDVYLYVSNEKAGPIRLSSDVGKRCLGALGDGAVAWIVEPSPNDGETMAGPALASGVAGLIVKDGTTGNQIAYYTLLEQNGQVFFRNDGLADQTLYKSKLSFTTLHEMMGFDQVRQDSPPPK